jgi:hypothetical protein
MNLITTNMPKIPAPVGVKTQLAIVTKSESESCPFRALIDEWLEAGQAMAYPTKQCWITALWHISSGGGGIIITPLLWACIRIPSQLPTAVPSQLI